MSEQIVACIGCGKKFRIPDGAAPTGEFDCTACGDEVKYGGKAKAAAGKKAVAPGRGTTRGARRARTRG